MKPTREDLAFRYAMVISGKREGSWSNEQAMFVADVFVDAFRELVQCRDELRRASESLARATDGLWELP